MLEVEKRIRQKRISIFENNLKMAPIGFQREGYNHDDPLAYSEKLYNLTNINDIIMRIREGLSRIMPTRRIIARLVEWLHTERNEQWRHCEPGYTNFRDFAMDKLGMGEEYRDYLAVGKVLKEYYYFLDYLSDMDTEAVFLKLRYLDDAIKIHQGDEPLVLARLRSLTVREFKVFSVDPDFEITFSKNLTKKKRDELNALLLRTRDPFKMCDDKDFDFIEIHNKSEIAWVHNIVENVLAEATEKKESLELSALTPETKITKKALSPKKDNSSSVA